MKDDTTAENFHARRGGWNCQHQLYPVSEIGVPLHIREKFKNDVFNSRKQEYEKLKNNPDYNNVAINDKGGLKATHKDHIFQSKIGIFGVSRGTYEKNSVKALFNNGYKVYKR